MARRASVGRLDRKGSPLMSESIDWGDECIEWRARCDGHGYGQLYYHGKRWPVHRLVYHEVHHCDPCPPVVRHTCDNPPCFNPRHLLGGTQADNVQDCIDRGRRSQARPGRCKSRAGEKNPRAKLTWQGVEKAKQLHEEGFGCTALARQFSVNVSTIRRAITGKSWRREQAR